eukprot:scaffold3199_cov165-Amphora_coffeaeformis.AAC.4
MTRTPLFLVLASLLARNSQAFTPPPSLRSVLSTSSSSLNVPRWMAVKPLADDDEEDDKKQQPSSKEEMYKKVGEAMRQQKDAVAGDDDEGVLDRLNPFKAGQNLRKTIDKTLQGLSAGDKMEQEDSLYYLNDRVFEDGGTSFMSLEDRLLQDDYVPEILVVGATGEVGSLVVRRLLREKGRFRVRVLVRDLYTRTLNRLGTGVTYCQGDLNNVDSLEYALTDVDKIIFCASPPKPDEEDFRAKFKDYVQETLRSADGVENVQGEEDDAAWERLDSVLQLRAELAEQVDCIGMKNVITAYQHVRHADYGTSQAAKRTLFKFEGRPQDFNLFSVDQTGDDNDTGDSIDSYYEDVEDLDGFDNYDDNEDDEYIDEYDKYGEGALETRRDNKVQAQTQWLRNKFGHAVFVGRLPKAMGGMGGGEAAVISSRFRSRDNPDDGIDLSTQFSGMIVRVCADGGVYEAFVRTGLYKSDGIEYVCEFSTNTKATGYMKSKNKFSTVRLPFENFQPVARKEGGSTRKAADIPTFRGKDIQYIASDRDRTEEEVYYKFRGEEILKNSGLSYTIVRVMNYNESPASEASTIDLKASNNEIMDVSRAEVAQVAVSALMDPKALNKSFYVSKKVGKASARDEDISAKFSALPTDVVV